jgi:hypothetical protein
MKIRSYKKIFKLLVLVAITTGSFAQHKSTDSLLAFQEIARVRQIFSHLPVQLNIHIENTAEPVTNPNDTINSDISLYYGKPGFYMQTDGLEEIANDSFIVMVNNQAKQILLYQNNRQIMQKMESGFSTILPDSSQQYLSKTYSSDIQDMDAGRKKIVLRSREVISGTNFPKETVTLLYQPASYEGTELNQVKLKLLPVDSAVYASLVNNKEYEGKLLKSSSKMGDVFFMVKKQNTTYKFKNIDYKVQSPPVKPEDRIQKAGNGNYIPAKGFEEYVLSKEF